MSRIISIKQTFSGEKVSELIQKVEFVETEIRLEGELVLKNKELYQRYEGSELQRCIDYLLYGSQNVILKKENLNS